MSPFGFSDEGTKLNHRIGVAIATASEHARRKSVGFGLVYRIAVEAQREFLKLKDAAIGRSPLLVFRSASSTARSFGRGRSSDGAGGFFGIERISKRSGWRGLCRGGGRLLIPPP
jgi:hypothetical protein